MCSLTTFDKTAQPTPIDLIAAVPWADLQGSITWMIGIDSWRVGV